MRRRNRRRNINGGIYDNTTVDMTLKVRRNAMTSSDDETDYEDDDYDNDDSDDNYDKKNDF